MTGLFSNTFHVLQMAGNHPSPTILSSKIGWQEDKTSTHKFTAVQKIFPNMQFHSIFINIQVK